MQTGFTDQQDQPDGPDVSYIWYVLRALNWLLILMGFKINVFSSPSCLALALALFINDRVMMYMQSYVHVASLLMLTSLSSGRCHRMQ